VLVLFALNTAQPPTVAASDAAVIKTLTPGAPAAGRLAGLADDMMWLQGWEGNVLVIELLQAEASV
jgi:hypothetical protein